MNLRRRLELLEKRLNRGSIILFMPDGRTETLRGGRYYSLDLFARACNGERTPDMELIAQSIGSIEPGGAHILDLVRGVLDRVPDEEPDDGCSASCVPQSVNLDETDRDQGMSGMGQT
jgi:hypothetical protein